MRSTRQIGVLCATALGAATLVGCATDQRPQDVPSTAMNKVEGDQRLIYTAADSGTVWVTEGATNIIYSTPVSPGDRVVLDPSVGKLTLNDRVVLDKDVNRIDHKIFFQAGAAPPPAAIAASDRSVSRPEGVPGMAVIGAEGKDRVAYTARRDGFVWITDEDQHRVLYSAPVNRGDEVIVDPQKNVMAINGQPIQAQPLNPDNHRIFFSNQRPIWQSADGTPAEGAIIRPADVPSDAASRVQGTGRIDYVADRDGTIWISDLTTGHTVYSGRILKNDQLTLDANENLLSLNGQRVHTQDLPRDRYGVFFAER